MEMCLLLKCWHSPAKGFSGLDGPKAFFVCFSWSERTTKSGVELVVERSSVWWAWVKQTNRQSWGDPAARADEGYPEKMTRGQIRTNNCKLMEAAIGRGAASEEPEQTSSEAEEWMNGRCGDRLAIRRAGGCVERHAPRHHYTCIHRERHRGTGDMGIQGQRRNHIAETLIDWPSCSELGLDRKIMQWFEVTALVCCIVPGCVRTPIWIDCRRNQRYHCIPPLGWSCWCIKYSTIFCLFNHWISKFCS